MGRKGSTARNPDPRASQKFGPAPTVNSARRTHARPSAACVNARFNGSVFVHVQREAQSALHRRRGRKRKTGAKKSSIANYPYNGLHSTVRHCKSRLLQKNYGFTYERIALVHYLVGLTMFDALERPYFRVSSFFFDKISVSSL